MKGIKKWTRRNKKASQQGGPLELQKGATGEEIGTKETMRFSNIKQVRYHEEGDEEFDGDLPSPVVVRERKISLLTNPRSSFAESVKYILTTSEIWARRGLITFVAVIGVWNLTKIPYFMSFGNDEDSAYNSHGIEVSINLGHWIDGYRSKKMRCPADNFYLLHTALGVTILAMIVLTLFNGERRRRYCIPFFSFAIIEGIHALPAAWINDAGLAPLFLFACVVLIVTALWGLYTKMYTFDKNTMLAEKNLRTQYFIISAVNCFAAFLEIPQIINALKYHHEHGEWFSYGDAPQHLFGHTFYDKFHQKVGYTLFLLFVFIVWGVWPLLLTEISPPVVIMDTTDSIDDEEEEATESTPFIAEK